MADINLKNLQRYEQVFGLEKMISLFEEFQKKALSELNTANSLFENEKLDSLRLMFHSMRSAALVFGMDTFSQSCAQIEENIISRQFTEMLEKEIKQSKMVFEEEIKEVSAYLNRGKNV